MRACWVDTTLRDGAQMPGVVFTSREKHLLLREMARSGVTVFEVGSPAAGKSERADLKDLLDAGIPGDMIAWNRAVEQDVVAALECGFKHIHVSLPVSDLHIREKLRRDKEWVLGQLDSCVRLVRSAGAIPYVGAEDAARGDDTFFLQYAQVAAAAGAKRIRFADTVGILMPDTIMSRLGKITKQCPIPIEFHGHNDFGLALANAAAAIQAGTEWVSGSLCGIGERAGNTDFGLFAAWLARTGDGSVYATDSLVTAEAVIRRAVARIPAA